MTRTFPLLIGAVMSLAACGATSNDPTGNPIDQIGWRRGIVLQVGDAATLGPIDSGDCRQREHGAAPVDGRYVEVQYFVGRHAHLRIVPLVDGAHVAPGDAVYFKPGSCADAVVR